MPKYTTKEISSQTAWENFIEKHGVQSFLQSWNWGETHKSLGETIYRLGFYEKGVLKAVSLCIKQTARRGPHFLIPGGPVIDWNDKGIVNYVVSEIRALAKKEKVWFVRMRCELHDTKENKAYVKKLGFVRAPMHLHAENTWVLGVERSEDEILAGMRKNTRYLVRKSLEAGLNLEVTKDTKNLEILTQLQEETVKRHKFVGFSQKLFEAQMNTFGKDKQAGLFVVKKGKVPLVAAIIIFYAGYAYYHHSGSSEKFKEIPSSYFLQWNVIKEARKRKLKGYNFWGIAPEGKTKHRFSGVTTFKTGFGGKRIDWLPAQDLVISPLYFTTYTFETYRRLSRGL